MESSISCKQIICQKNPDDFYSITFGACPVISLHQFSLSHRAVLMYAYRSSIKKQNGRQFLSACYVVLL